MPAAALPMDRPTLLQRLRSTDRYDLIVIGGGATGLGVALDAAARGHRVALLEAQDFAKGTSSRSTKLVHGGVRYLAQGKLGLVREALHERATLLANAPHLARPLPFVMPGYRFWERPWYGLGLKMYDALAGSRGLGATQLLSSAEVRDRLPGVRASGLHGGVRYWDAQFDDARLAVTLARTAWLQGAAVLNHCPVTALLHRRDDEAERVCGVRARDAESGESFELRADCIVNATGVWVDAVRDMDHAAAGEPPVRPMVSPSQGVHLVVDRSFLGGDHALLVPKTADGRVLFAVPWLGMTVLGTTDTPRGDLASEPTPFAEEVAFILGEAGRYLTKAPRREDVRSVWVGLRPLVRPDSDTPSTQAISREHAVRIGHSKLVTVTGGKWTTYRSMAEDVLARCSEAGLLTARPAGVTTRLPLAGAPAQGSVALSQAPGEHLYGDDATLLRSLPGAERWLWRADTAGDAPHGLSEAMVRFAVRHEMARGLEDVLARRSRLLFLDAARAEALAEPVAAILAEELGRPIDARELAAFRDLAQRYRTLP
ncbi:MAG: glycerol-3-phosphate dehydrogenase/oxidase [Piscinibacter sp.]|uniref:glycerol-3-phosphate dehydrogenase/oxidase n=2 Tax=Piscinibacter TaxID=1114981 RepID=UPI000FDDA12B|nr:glycerol-3-phosphate dehydrogenase/oxidase [Piscinibacter sp.]